MADEKIATLYVIATPIGNLDDVTLRSLKIMGEVDALACEDTRHTPRIFERHNVHRPELMFPYHDHNEERAAERIMSLLADGKSVGIVTNAGYPGVSDPGYRIVSRAAEAGYKIEVLPGAGAVEAALLISGLPSSSYTFKGFPPKKPGKRKNWLEQEREMPHTLIFFESPHRLAILLEDALAVYGDRRAAVCFELTKVFENVHRGFLSELSAKFKDAAVKGEIAVVIAGNNPKFSQEDTDES